MIMRIETKTREEYLNEINEIATAGDSIKFLEDGLAFFNCLNVPLSKWIEESNEVIYW